MIKILRDSDSSRIRLTPTVPDGLDLTGAALVFELNGFRREFTEFADGVTLALPREFTAAQPVGRQLASWSVRWPDGRKVIAENTFPVYFTDVVQDVSEAETARIAFDVSTALEGLTFDRNATSSQLLTVLAQAFKRLGGDVKNNP